MRKQGPDVNGDTTVDDVLHYGNETCARRCNVRKHAQAAGTGSGNVTAQATAAAWQKKC